MPDKEAATLPASCIFGNFGGFSSNGIRVLIAALQKTPEGVAPCTTYPS
jgi:hypothetical protein